MSAQATTTTSTACGRWALAPDGFLTEASCERPHGHEGDHLPHDAYGVVVLLVPDTDMLAEAIDGHPVMFQVRSTDTCAQDLGTVAASDDQSAWLPVMPDGGHGPLAPTAQSAAVWLARARVRVYTSGTSPVLPCPVSEWKGYV